MIFISKEMNKKTGLTKLEKENLGNVNGGYEIITYDDGTVAVRGLPRNNRAARYLRPDIRPINVPQNGPQEPPRVYRRFSNLFHAVIWANKNLLPNQTVHQANQPQNRA